MATKSFSKFIATNATTCIYWGIIGFFPNTHCVQCVVVFHLCAKIPEKTHFKEGNIGSRVQRFWFMTLRGEVGHHKKGVSQQSCSAQTDR